jgi:hypothetical protein
MYAELLTFEIGWDMVGIGLRGMGLEEVHISGIAIKRD